MQISKILVVVYAATAAVALPTETNTGLEKENAVVFWDGVNAPIPGNTTNAALMISKPATAVQTRQAAGLAEAVSATVKAIAKAVGWAYAAFTWDQTRQRFTQETVKEMMDTNPDFNTWPAAVCYNLGYRVRDSNRISPPQSQKLTSGLLYTNYDCMFIMTNNAFWTDGDGGFQNLAYSYDSTRCSYDGATGDLTC